jgi:hypothetical protein
MGRAVRSPRHHALFFRASSRRARARARPRALSHLLAPAAPGGSVVRCLARGDGRRGRERHERFFGGRKKGWFFCFWCFSSLSPLFSLSLAPDLGALSVVLSLALSLGVADGRKRSWGCRRGRRGRVCNCARRGRGAGAQDFCCCGGDAVRPRRRRGPLAGRGSRRRRCRRRRPLPLFSHLPPRRSPALSLFPPTKQHTMAKYSTAVSSSRRKSRKASWTGRARK